MPFRSNKQRRWMFSNKPAMAKKWAQHGKKRQKRTRRKKKS